MLSRQFYELMVGARACCREETPEIQGLRRAQRMQKNVTNFISFVAAHSNEFNEEHGHFARNRS
jgi:hypothetical protein